MNILKISLSVVVSSFILLGCAPKKEFTYVTPVHSYVNEKDELLNKINSKGYLFLEEDFKQYASKFSDDKDVMMMLFQSRPVMFLKYASERIKNDYDCAKTAVKRDGNSLQFLGDSMKNNDEIVLLATAETRHAIPFIGKTLLNDKEFIIKQMKKNDNVMKYVSNEIKNDKEYLIFLLKETNSKEIIFNASDNVRKDKYFQKKADDCTGFSVNKERCLKD